MKFAVTAGAKSGDTAKHNIDVTNVMPAKISLIGQTFGKLKVINDAPNHTTPGGTVQARSNAICECGQIIIVRNSHLKNGHTKSCGCLDQTTHGMSRTQTYRSWAEMIQRCTNPNKNHYNRYGGRGISVCERWRNSFEDFLTDMGKRPQGKTLDRINDSGNYEPGNCRWATKSDQARNREGNRIVTVSGFSGCLKAVCEHFGVADHYHSINTRMYQRNWDPEKAVLTPF